jgi:hypothetical protein
MKLYPPPTRRMRMRVVASFEEGLGMQGEGVVARELPADDVVA